MKGMCYIEPLFYKVEDSSKTKTRRIKKGKPRYKVGDIVYLKEPYFNISGLTFYKFDKNRPDIAKCLWKNKLFMPESAARVFIEITEVREERLQDISEEDCIKEGITRHHASGMNWYENGLSIKIKNSLPQSGWTTAREAYAALIDHINSKGTWDSNPLVYVYGFRKYDRTWEYSQSRG